MEQFVISEGGRRWRGGGLFALLGNVFPHALCHTERTTLPVRQPAVEAAVLDGTASDCRRRDPSLFSEIFNLSYQSVLLHA